MKLRRVNACSRLFSATLLVVAILLITQVSAMEWDNTKSYNKELKEVTIVNAWGLGDDIAKIKLTSPLKVRVSRGYQKIAEFDLIYYMDDNGGLDLIEFFNIKDSMNQINRQFDFKIKSIKEVFVNDYETICEKVLSENKTLIDNCTQNLIGNHIEERIVWDDDDFNEEDLIKGEEVSIGIFTNAQVGDYVEWIPTFYGIKINEWASYLVDDLVAYFKLDNNNFTDSVNSISGSNEGTSNVDGISGDGRDFERDETDWIDYGDNFDVTGNYLSINAWVYLEIGDGKIVGKDQSGGRSYSLGISAGGGVDFEIAGSSGGDKGTVNTGEWAMITATFDDTINTTKFYINGTYVGIKEDITTHLTDTGTDFRLGMKTYSGAENYFDGIIDEVGIWDIVLNQLAITDLYNNSDPPSYPFEEEKLNIILISPSDNFISSDVGMNFTANYSVNSDYNLTNVTYYIWNSTEIFNDSIVVEITGTSNLTLKYIDAFILGNYEWNVYVCYEKPTFSNCTFADSNYSFFIGASIDAEEYNNETYETSYETFSVNITLLEGAILYDAEFVYNGTHYSANIDNLGNNQYYLEREISIPSIDTESSMPFYWVLYYDVGEVIIQNLTIRNQLVLTITDIIITNETCGEGMFATINYTFADERNLSTLKYNIKYNFKFGVGDLIGNVVNGTFTNISDFKICINQTIDAYKLGYGEIEYDLSGYVSRRYYMFEEQSLSNSTTNNIIIYQLESSKATSFLFEIKNTFLNPYINKLVGLLRWYPQNDEYKVVELAKTDEDGQALMKVEVEDVDYRIGVYDLDGSLIKLAEPIRMACLIEPCTYSLIIISEEKVYFDIYGIESSLTFDEDNNRFVYIWNDPSQLTSGMRLIVVKESGFQEVVICNSTAEGYTGVLTCSIGTYTGLLTAKAFRTASPETIFSSLSKTIGNFLNNDFGLFAAWMLLLIAALSGIWSPIAAIILSIPALILAVIFGTINFTIFMGIVVLAGIVIHMIKKTR